jgi:hypothetical protein
VWCGVVRRRVGRRPEIRRAVACAQSAVLGVVTSRRPGQLQLKGLQRRVGRSKLVHTLDALTHAWERADGADADLLEGWLVGRHRAYQEITEAHSAAVTKRREERKRFRDLMNCPA